MKIALAIIVGLLSGLGLYFIRRRSRRGTRGSQPSEQYTPGTDGVFFYSGEIYENQHDSSGGGAHSGWGSYNADSSGDSGGGDSGGGDGGGGDGGGGE